MLVAEEPSPDVQQLIAGHTAVFTQPPRHVPTDKTPDGPLLGNGDVGVVLSGPPERQLFHIGKNDFWSRRCIVTVGGVALAIPELAGAAYKQEQDLLNAEVRGLFTKGGLTVRTRSWVCATENLLVTELTAALLDKPAVAQPVEAHATLFCGTAGQARSGTAGIKENNNRVNLGREQHGGGRWYFDGLIDEVRVYDCSLPAADVAALRDLKDVRDGLIRCWGFDEEGGETAKDASGNGSDGKITGIREAGKKGQALSLDGKRGYADCPPVRVSKGLTVAAYVFPRTHAKEGEAQYIFSKGEWNDAYSLGLSAGKLRFAVGNDFAQAAKPLPLNQWVHVAGTFDGRRIRVYVDGTEAAVQGSGSSLPAAPGAGNGLLWFTRSGTAEPIEWRKVSVACRLLGSELRPAADLEDDSGVQAALSLQPGKTVTLVSAILSDRDAANHLDAVKQRVAELDSAAVEKLNREHRQWWRRFWGRSFLEIHDKVIESHYYGALYILGSCNRPGKIAPGLFGNWITTDRPAWQGDYTLNYNFEAPYYGVDVANRGDLALPYFDAIIGLLPQGREMAAKRNWKGVHFPTHFGPYGLLTEGWQDWGQRSDAAYAALPFIDHCIYSQDAEFLKQQAYPFLLEVGAFWEDYLKFENGRYVIYNDSIHEGSGTDCNPVLTLGLVRRLFSSLLEFSTELGVDEGRRGKWRHILDHLAAYPLQERNGKTVFRYTEKGTPWWNDNGLGIQHIYPAGAIGLDSDPKLLDISRNMVEVMGRWTDGNCFSSFYPAAARVAYAPEIILRNLRLQCDKHAFPNLHFVYGGGGIENCSGVLVGLQEMLLQSHEGTLRFFPCWPRDQNARFGRFRARGAFLVSAEFKDGNVRNVSVVSEKGRDCTVLNPWPGKAVRLSRSGTEAEAVQGERFTIKTQPGETVALTPVP